MHKIVLSEDGSHTIISEKFGVAYHSKHGALQETETVFLNAGLQYAIDNNPTIVNILEMGFGTGLNAIMTFLKDTKDIKINFHTIEAYPIPEVIYSQLNYPELLNMDKYQHQIFIDMHKGNTGTTYALSPNFNFTKHILLLEDFDPGDQKFDVIYYDAFAPSSQEELWSEEMMVNLASMCNTNGALVTYCAKGSFKRALRAAGFTVEGLPGPKGKREMTRGII
ncbi:MAG: tRNA (5-methylaminomethyl-2-thiouridine)(34)-methyltransferase MnmD [Saprospiraceae bacterium]